MSFLVMGDCTKNYREWKSYRNNDLLIAIMKPQFALDRVKEQRFHNTSLPIKILKSAEFLFRQNGFEETTVQDICSCLNIKSNQFYNYFESLDEVLDILWDR